MITKILSQLKDSQSFDCSTYQIKVPNIKKGYVGEDIPVFAISAQNATTTNNLVATSSSYVDTKRTDGDIVKPFEPERVKQIEPERTKQVRIRLR
jgi:hypothetical protein